MPIDIGVDVLDEDFAPELLAEEVDVAADDRPQIEEDRRLTAGQRGQEFAESLRREDRVVPRQRRGGDTRLRVRTPRRETIEQAQY